MVLGGQHSLSTAEDAGALHALLRSTDVDVMIVDPAMQEGERDGRLEEIIGSNPHVPAIAYTVLTPSAMRQVIGLARVGLQHVVLHRFDDEPGRFLDLIELAPAHPLAEAMLRELAVPLRELPVIVTRAIEQLFRSPARVKNTQELARLAGTTPRTLYRHMMPVGLPPRQLLICARLLRTYTLVREPGVRVKEVAVKLGYADPDHLTEQLREWTGCSPKDVRSTLTPDRFVRLLTSHLLRSNAEHGVEDATEPV